MVDVLIVEDSPTASFVLRHMIESLGFSVAMASNGSHALEMAKKQKPELILMDLMMPIMDGYQATRIFKTNAELKGVPVVIHSSKSQTTDKLWAKKQGASGFLAKPASKRQLQRMMNYFLPNHEVS
ncbi:MAG: Two-component system response regulator [uncultured Thiotrichaceae bacterium]|uniref:Two-component system response regulator n=1 Tax=uncultured Thiotrichaceae bacterium TaxID=298394 RepID=A0A6S6U1C5_9GAMM|nr:MAG: Two-component system response regulator [uncultured Thiotrichaceae bacterium]